MTQVTPLATIVSGYLATQQINSNFQLIAAALASSLSRVTQTGVANNMDSDLDMDSNRIINLPAPVNPTDAATKDYVDKGLPTLMQQYVQDAEDARDLAQSYAVAAANSAVDALGYSNSASGYAVSAGSSASDALGYANSAQGYSNSALGSANTASQAVIDSQAAQTAAENARDAILNDAGFIAVYAALANLNAVANDLTNINLVANDLTNIDLVAGSITNVNSVASDLANVDLVASNLTNVGLVAADITNVNSVAGSIANVNSVAADLTNINNVATDLTNIDAVATDLTNINTVATNISDVNTCATNIAAIIAAPTEASNAAASASEAASYASIGTSFKNMLIGSNMNTNRWTKGTSLAVAANTAITSCPDNWLLSNQTDGAITVSKQTGLGAVGSGRFSTSSVKINVDTIDATIAAGQYALFQQNIEGSTIARCGFGISGTRYTTLSYLLKSNVTGTMCVFLSNAATDRCYIKEISVTGDGVARLISFVVPVDTSGTWLSTESTLGIKIGFMLACGSTYQGTKEDWTQNVKIATSNQTNFLATQNNYIQLDLVQFEKGAIATPFEYRDIGTEQMLQDRYLPIIKSEGNPWYFGNAIGTGTGAGIATYNFKVKPCKYPTGLTASNAAHMSFTDGAASITTNAITFNSASKERAVISVGFASGGTQYRPYEAYLNNAAAYIYFTGAEI